MPKNKDKNGVEYWRGKYKQVEKKARQLEKRVRQLEKTEHMFEDALMSPEPLEYEIATRKRTCEECGKGKISEINILDRIFEECDVCDHRKKIRGPSGS